MATFSHARQRTENLAIFELLPIFMEYYWGKEQIVSVM